MRKRTITGMIATYFALALVLLGCATPGSSPGAASSVKMDLFLTLSGPEAAIAQQFLIPGVLAAQQAINAQGGILGKQLSIESTDSKGDAADAVLAANHLLNEQSPPVAVIGPETTEGSATIPLFNQAHIVMMSPDGSPALDHNTLYPFLYRPIQPDSMQGIAMSAAALQAGYKHAAVIFANDGGSQSIVPGLVRSFEAHGGSVVINEQLIADQPGYRTEIEKMLAASPQLIFTESDPQTAATFFSELRQLHGLPMIPVYGTTLTSAPSYLSALANAIGGYGTVGQFFSMIDYGSQTTPGFAAYQTAFKKVKANAGDDPAGGINANFYDATIVLALAMTEANSTDPAHYSSYIKDITTNASYTHVSDYASGLQALKAGKRIYYDGASGPLEFNQFNYVTGAFDVSQVDAGGHVIVRTQISNLSNYAPTN